MTVTVKNPTVNKEVGVEHGVLVKWSMSKANRSKTDHFTVDYEYWTGSVKRSGNGVTEVWSSAGTTDYSVAASEIANTNTFRVSWTAPANALKARARVLPVAKPKSSDDNTPKYKGKYTGKKTVDFRTDALPAPTISASLDADTSQVTVTVTSSDADARTCQIQAINAAKSVKYDSKSVSLSNGGYTIRTGVTAGETWTFQALVRSHGDSAESPWAYATPVIAKPPAPTLSSVAASGDDGIKATYSSVLCQSYTVEYVADSYEYFKTNRDAVRTVTNVEGTTFIQTGLELGHNWYVRVRAVNQTGEGPWSTGQSAAKLVLTPDVPTTFDTDPSYKRSDSARLRWVHNCEGNSEQSAAQVAVKLSTQTDSQATVTDVATDMFLVKSLSSYSDNSVVKWRVRTKGNRSEWSPWSVWRQFTVYDLPSVTCSLSQNGAFTLVQTSEQGYSGKQPNEEGWYEYSAEGGYSATEDVAVEVGKDYYRFNASGTSSASTVGNALRSIPLLVTINSQGGGGAPVGYHLTFIALEGYSYEAIDGTEIMVPEGSVVYQKDYVTSSRRFNTEVGIEAGLQDGVSYAVVAEVAMNSGLHATSTRYLLDVDFNSKIPEPEGEVVFSPDDLTAEVRCACYEEIDGPGDTFTLRLVNGVDLSVYRINADRSVTLVQQGLPNTGNVSVVDPHATFGTCRYRIVARSLETGESVYSDEESSSVHSTCCVQWDESWSEYVESEDDSAGAMHTYTGNRIDGIYNLNLDESGNMQSEDAEYIGRKHPVSYYGTQRGHTADYRVDFPKYDTETLMKCRRLMDYAGDAYVREPSGLGFWARISNPRISRSYDSQAVSFTFEAVHVDHAEKAVG